MDASPACFTAIALVAISTLAAGFKPKGGAGL